ncbi:MAG: DUF4198 domain-containing protein [Sphingomicrobium sp.]
MLKLIQSAALFIAFTGIAEAHDSWLQPKTYQAAAGDRVPLTFYVGHHGEQHSAKLSPRPSWLLAMKARGSVGTANLLKARGFKPSAGVPLDRPGTYLLSLDTRDFRNPMSAKNFETYLEEEGLAGAEAAWRRAPVTSRKVRESYRRHAKALVQVGTGPQALEGPVTQRIGQRLEIVPGANPYALGAGSSLPATVWFRGKPLAGALVTLGDLDRPKDPLVTVRSDAAGRVSFRLPRPGRWMMNVVWSVPSSAASTDFETSFSSLTFAVPDQR